MAFNVSASALALSLPALGCSIMTTESECASNPRSCDSALRRRLRCDACSLSCFSASFMATLWKTPVSPWAAPSQGEGCCTGEGVQLRNEKASDRSMLASVEFMSSCSGAVARSETLREFGLPAAACLRAKACSCARSGVLVFRFATWVRGHESSTSRHYYLNKIVSSAQ